MKIATYIRYYTTLFFSKPLTFAPVEIHSLTNLNKMKKKLLNAITVCALLITPTINYAQAPPLGTAADYVLFSTVGAVGNTGISHLTGNVGTNNGGITGFGNVNGQMHNADGSTGQASADLLIAYNLLNVTIPTFFPAPLLGNGQVLNAGVYSIAAATTLNLDLTLDAQGNANAVFIFQIQAPFSTNANSKVKLMNGAQACNVFWKVEGLVSMAPGTTMRGTVIANNAAINMNTNDTLEGRALSTTGAITVNGVLAYTPIGCGSPVLTGPAAPNMASVGCYGVFSSDGAVFNAGVTHVTGDVGTNVGLTTGFNPLFVNGAIHPIPDGSTAAAAADLIGVYNYLNNLTYDIELLYPAQFGHNLVLTPHTYLLSGATSLTDSLYLDGMNDTNAVFTIQINGAFSTSTFAKVILINGARARNVYWKVDGAVSINDYSEINGTVVCNNGAILVNTGATINGRLLTTTGSLTTSAITVVNPSACGSSSGPVILSQPTSVNTCLGSSAMFFVNASGSNLTYQWRRGTVNLVNGLTISGATSDSLTINPVNAGDAGADYNVVVTGTSGSDTSSNVSLLLNAGPAVTCPGNQIITSATSTMVTYTSSSTGNPTPVVSYSFSGATIGTGTGDGSGSLFNVGTTNVTLTVVNSCGNSSCSFNIVITPPCTAPVAPGAISGPSVVCQLNSATYSIAPVAGATSYNWTVPTGITGMTITSGQGTTSINVNISAGTVIGNVSVTATNNCGTSSATTYMVTKKPQTSSTISGPTDICGITSATYSIPSSFGATSYTWLVPAGMTITGGSGTTTISVNIASTFTQGLIRVMAVNACGSIPGTQLLVYGKVPPTAVTGPANVCGMTTAMYYSNTVVNANSYVWTVPASWTITGQGNDTIIATMPANINNVAFSGTVKVYAVSGCGSSAAKAMTVSYCKSAISMLNSTEDTQLAFSAVYPNPTSSAFTIDVTSEVENEVIVQVYDVLGNLVVNTKHQVVSGTNTLTTNIGDFKNGMYFVRLLDVNSNVIHSQTVIKQ